MGRGYIFKPGDRIRVVSNKSKYKGYLGTVFAYHYYSGNVSLFLDGTIYQPNVYKNSEGKYRDKYLTLKDTSVQLITNQNECEVKEMEKLTGYNKVAVVKMSGVDYHYALYDESIEAGDSVLISGACERVVVVDEVISVEEARARFSKNITAEVKCKVDLSAYNQRVENRVKAAELRKKMDQKIAEMDEMNKYVVYADRNPELAKMLAEYRDLV